MKARTPEQEAVYQQLITEATEVILAMNLRIFVLPGRSLVCCWPTCR